jgi:YD repeat-containing protein
MGRLCFVRSSTFAPLQALLIAVVVGVGVWPGAASAHVRAESRLLTTHLPTTTYTANATWTVANSPYVLDGNITVASAATLTIEPGVIVKLNGTSRTMTVNGTLKASGTAESGRIIFTSYQDDSAGGDTNGDGGATSGAPGQWLVLRVDSANAASELKFVDVRYGASGSPLGRPAALEAKTLGTSVLVEDSTFTQNLNQALKTTANGTVTVRRTTIANNGAGIAAISGGVSVADNSSIRENGDDGLFFNLLSSYTGPTSSIIDSEVKSNGGNGISLLVDAGLDASRWPHGNRNNIYDNTSRQLYASAVKRTVDWTQNYWGEVNHRANSNRCLGVGQNSLGKLAYNNSHTTPPEGPISAASYTVTNPTVSCYYDYVAVGPLEFSPFALRGAGGVPTGQTLGECDRFIHANNADACLEDPVNSATGAFTHAEDDLALPGIGVGFDFRRVYNSLDPTPGPLGAGWTHSYNASLTVKASGDVTLRGEDGQQIEYTKQQDGSFVGAAGALSTLTPVPGGGYLLTRKDQVKYGFDANGRLLSIKDRNNQGLTMAYDGSGRLSTVTDASNRAATLTYNTSNQLTGISLPDGRSVSYGYTSGSLTSYTDPAARTWTYTYDAHNWLEKEIDPLSHTIFRNVYADDGRVSE